jgi:hypothetical protein
MTNSAARCLVFAAVAGVLAACAPSQAQTSVPAAPSGHVPAASKGPPTGLALRGLTDRLVLSRTRVAAGTPIAGVLVVTYRGDTPVNLNRGCRPQYAVALTRRGLPPRVGFPADCGVAPFIIKPGQNRLPVTVATTYSACTQAAGQATSAVPACGHGRQVMPPLPPGRYRTVLLSTGFPFPAPAPVQVTLSSPAGNPM